MMIHYAMKDADYITPQIQIPQFSLDVHAWEVHLLALYAIVDIIAIIILKKFQEKSKRQWKIFSIMLRDSMIDIKQELINYK